MNLSQLGALRKECGSSVELGIYQAPLYDSPINRQRSCESSNKQCFSMRLMYFSPLIWLAHHQRHLVPLKLQVPAVTPH